MHAATIPPDNTPLGDRRWDRASYAFIQSALLLLQAKLKSWNTIAIRHGALVAPYVDELAVIEKMATWGDAKLSDEHRPEIVVTGITVGSIRYLKAALLHASWHFEAEAAENAKDSWPSPVLEAIRGRARRCKEFADQMEFPAASILDDLRPGFGMKVASHEEGSTWDAFVSHASEDKHPFVQSLAELLQANGLSVWYDSFTLTVGDSLRRSIDRGLAQSRFGIVVLSPAFFAKEWPQRELDGLVAREVEGRKVILPVWHNVNEPDVRRYSPTLADRLGVHSGGGVVAVVQALLQAIRA